MNERKQTKRQHSHIDNKRLKDIRYTKNTQKSVKRDETNRAGGRQGGEGGGRRITVTHSPPFGGFSYDNISCLLDVRQIKQTDEYTGRVDQ